jgi:hypothetical protein
MNNFKEAETWRADASGHFSTVDWQCPFCNKFTTITSHNISARHHDLTIENEEGKRRLITIFRVCPNPNCKKYSLEAQLCEIAMVQSPDKKYHYQDGHTLKVWYLHPPSRARNFPNYVPKAVRDDYDEACLICDLSPKASATLSRRCLQGMVRDFWGVKTGNLYIEIDQIKDRVDPELWKAIDDIREVGNIGAHMQKDINHIIDVNKEEAYLLIRLIETLIEEWYIKREERKKRLKKLRDVDEKKAQKNSFT